MIALVVECKVPAGGWRKIATLKDGDLPGSFSDHAADQREVIIFTCGQDAAMVWRSLGGVDAEIGEHRSVLTLGQELLAKLSAGESWEREIQTDSGFRITARFRCVEVGN